MAFDRDALELLVVDDHGHVLRLIHGSSAVESNRY